MICCSQPAGVKIYGKFSNYHTHKLSCDHAGWIELTESLAPEASRGHLLFTNAWKSRSTLYAARGGIETSLSESQLRTLSRRELAFLLYASDEQYVERFEQIAIWRGDVKDATGA